VGVFWGGCVFFVGGGVVFSVGGLGAGFWGGGSFLGCVFGPRGPLFLDKGWGGRQSELWSQLPVVPP